MFYKLLDCKRSNRQMVQLREGIPDETFVEQIAMKLNLNGYHLIRVDFAHRKATIQLEDLQVRITLDFEKRACCVESRQSVG